MPIFRQPLQRISRDRHPCAMSQLPCSMLRALLLLACTAKVAAFAQLPAGEPGCVDMDPDVIQSAFAEAIQDVEVEGVPTITSCADVAASGGCADEEVAASCCATCALPQRVTYSVHARVMAFIKCVMHYWMIANIESACKL